MNKISVVPVPVPRFELVNLSKNQLCLIIGFGLGCTFDVVNFVTLISRLLSALEKYRSL